MSILAVVVTAALLTTRQVPLTLVIVFSATRVRTIAESTGAEGSPDEQQNSGGREGRSREDEAEG